KAEAALKAADLPPLAWYALLWSLERAGGSQRPRDIGEALILERYNISRLLDRLEADGLVQRIDCPEDARGEVVVITDAGKALRKRMWAVHGPEMAETMARFSAAEAQTIAKLLKKLG